MLNLIAVDDEADVQVLFEHFFSDEIESKKVDFHFANSGDECLEILSKLSGETVVLSDINMPKMGGVELLQKISEQFSHVSVFLVSAYDQSQYETDMKKYGAKGYVTKPVDFGRLKDQLAQYVG